MAKGTTPSVSVYLAPAAVLGVGLSVAATLLFLFLDQFGASSDGIVQAVDDFQLAPGNGTAWALVAGGALFFLIPAYCYVIAWWIRAYSRPIHEYAQGCLHAKYVLTVAQRVAHVGSWELDGATHAMQCSDELFRICGLEPQSVKPTLQFMLGLIHQDDRDAAMAAILATRDEGKEFRMQIRIVRPGGTVRHVVSVGEATRDDNGWIVKIIGALLDVTEQKETELALRRSEDQLRKLAAHQEHVREEERKHIARELHDELGGLLTGIKAYLSVAAERSMTGGAPANDLLLEASQLTDQASDTMRRVITELRPSILDQLGIWDALRWVASQTANRGTLQCECVFTHAAVNTTIDPACSIVLFRIAQEALTNVVRHAMASKVTICADRQGDSIVLDITDDGKGIDARVAATGAGWGIVGMRERARRLGGELNITGRPGKGTVVSLRLPIHSIVQSHHD